MKLSEILQWAEEEYGAHSHKATQIEAALGPIAEWLTHLSRHGVNLELYPTDSAKFAKPQVTGQLNSGYVGAEGEGVPNVAILDKDENVSRHPLAGSLGGVTPTADARPFAVQKEDAERAKESGHPLKPEDKKDDMGRERPLTRLQPGDVDPNVWKPSTLPPDHPDYERSLLHQNASPPEEFPAVNPGAIGRDRHPDDRERIKPEEHTPVPDLHESPNLNDTASAKV